VSTPKKEASDRVSALTEDLVCDLGGQSRLFWLYNEWGQERHLFPVRVGPSRRPGPYPEAFYAAQKWLRRNRDQLIKLIIEEFDYGAKRDDYGRGHEPELVRDLAKAIAPACEKPHPVDPVLAAAVLVRIGVDEFCRGYDEPKADSRSWSLEKALGFDPDEANELAAKANGLLFAGRWKEAVPLFEKALALCPMHFNALNDLTYIYGAYYPKCEKGLEYARQLFHRTMQGAPNEPEILDTIGWAGFRHGGDIDTVEALLREAVKWIKSGESGYISVAYHLMAVLVARGKRAEATTLFESFVDLPPTSTIDAESLGEAGQLMA
jgi:tetratricopeptide (TPR) repeat protein